ncbi:hypothetical protein EVAR_101420_1 [Eumeta japonica]|uniref:Integrase catalytic domain-containing protein n=1 Tax=Eumeta variegata TaxID=151549 RepID=A0A4C1SHD0_EUMVA|nr:hypothetical protein EVAR_101420_1 [Eumeta japonica]
MADCIDNGRVKTTPLHPQYDGMIERFNSTLEDYLRKVVSASQKEWDEYIQNIYSHTVQPYTTLPHEHLKIVFGTELKLPEDLQFGVQPSPPNEATGNATQARELDELHNFVRSRVKMTSDKMTTQPTTKEGAISKAASTLGRTIQFIIKCISPTAKMKMVHLERLARYGKEVYGFSCRTGLSGRQC